MIRFAFNPNELSRKKIEQIRKEGITYAFSELFRTLSMTIQKDGRHRRFKHEAEILELLEVIDGTKEDENLLGFLDYDKIKDGKMCRHIVCVLPFRASCDAMKALILKNNDRFKNLDDYEIINIAGFDDESKYKSVGDVKQAIKKFENQNKKTLTLTVNRMLTGTTVPQWDTMLYLKGTASPQEYDQAIFRLQNQYVTTFRDENGKIIKYNMKPQTLLVDFDPNRMFVLQEQKSQFYNVNTEVQGNSRLKEHIAKELEISPIIVLNKNKLQQATPTNIIDAVREYSYTRSILDDASEIPADNDLLQDDTLAAILRTIEPLDAKNGLQIKPTEGEGDNIDVPDGEETNVPKEDSIKSDNPSTDTEQPTETIENDNLYKRLAAYYARILFFAFLTESTVKSLEDVISMIPSTEDNRRIANNLGLNIVLNHVQRKSNPFVLQKFDYKIENVNELMRDERLTPIKRVEVAMRKFGRMSDSEIVTPLNVADNVVKLLPETVFSDGPVLDIASKQGEFTIALLKRYGNVVSDKIYSVCTSQLAYEFTRKVYKLLSLPIDHIFNTFTSYDLIKKDKNKKYIIPQVITDMNFAAIIGNPPYQDRGGSGGTNDAPIFQHFCNVASALKPSNVSMIIPSKWFAGGRDSLLGEFRTRMLTSGHVKKLVAFTSSRELFPSVEIKGGICYFLLEDRLSELCDYSLHKDGVIIREKRNLALNEIFIRDPQLSQLVAHIKESHCGNFVDSLISADTPFGIPTNPEVNKNIKASLSQQIDESHSIELHYLSKLRRISAYIPKKIITKNSQDIKKPKVYIPKAGGSGSDTKVLSDPILALKPSVCSQTYVYASFNSADEAIAFEKYIRTKFLRILVSAAKVTQDALSKVYRFVPIQDFTSKSDIDWRKSVAEIDAQLYSKYSLSDEEIAFIESMFKPM